MPALRRRSTLAVLALVVVVVGIGAAWLLPSLGTGNAGAASGPPGSEHDADPETGAAVILFVPLGRVAFGVEVRNTTFLPVTIEGLVDDGSGFLLDGAHLVIGEGPVLGLEVDQTRAFEPLSLAPGETRLIGVVGRFPDCAHARQNWSPGTYAVVDSLRLDVRIAGILPAEADVPLLQAVELQGNDEEACP